ncbi:hypothetical protein [Vibrio coralliilyticus]|uniref:hypothetical protein n=1 Tax=Vibrio coralliilyticus TaxID=190893 RepID=UPI0015D4EB14|nr:hypothetical protein [Vibrio coralliilyticus]
MSSTNKYRNTRLHRSSLLACSLSLMIGLSGCGDSGELSQSEADGGTQDTSSGTDENHDNNSNQDNDVNQDAEGDEPSNGQGEEDSGTSNPEDNSDSGDGGSDLDPPEEDTGQGGEDTSGGRPDDADTPTDTATLHYQFTRSPLPPNSAPHVQRQNQELSGRPFQIEIYTLDDDLKLQDVTTEVTWNAVSEECDGEPCYTIDSEGRLIAGAKGKFSAQAEYNGLLTSVIQFETPRKLETCGVEGNTDKANLTEECLHIIIGSSGQADGDWFTEPPRALVMSYMYYEFDDTQYNSGYTHSGYLNGDGSAMMRNDGFDPEIEDTSRLQGGDFGQYDRFCKDLSQIEFNGRGNWRRARQEELISLANQNVSTYGWSTSSHYAAVNVHISKGQLLLRHVDMSTGIPVSKHPSERSLSTCVSELPTAP